MNDLPSSISSRFWSKVIKTNGCWMWIGATAGNGYGVFTPRKPGQIYAHRFSFEISNGGIPRGLMVLHKCDNPPCVNPDHLFLGTQKDNMKDCASKGRLRKGNRNGELNGRAKLTWDRVSEIREKYSLGNISQHKLALEYKVYVATINKIINRKTWRGETR